ncbi:MAG: ribosome small subunit-dependent GTPase A, partial [Flavobacteriaceae bacterium]|nr:ribosome small subunit-dependent GTPase A [Flavobacteriaceae bacterium]
MTGTVYKSTGSWYFVKSESGLFYRCRIKGKFRLKGIKSTNPIAVGDEVEFDIETKGDEEVGVIKLIHERKNYIVRKSVNLSKQTQIIASNIDLAFLLITINNPPTLSTFIDRFLVTAQAYSIEVILVFNKIDTYQLEQQSEISYLKDIYEPIGYTCVEVSAKENTNIEVIKNLMKQKTSMFSGHSGVGKTTLLNAIEPGLNLKTKQISDQHQQGQHTTTFAEMFDLSFDAKIIDTPGIKGFGVVAIEKEELGDY